MKSNTKKMVLNAILLAIALLLHQLTPALGLPIQPDMALAMLFIIVVINKNDYKACLVCGIITGIFTAMTTKFPGGQIPNIIDKIITVNAVYLLMKLFYGISFIKNLSESTKDFVVEVIIIPIGTLISGTVFLYSASLIVGLPGSFTALFMAAVVPAVILNLIAGLFLYKIVTMSIKRTTA
ncbi:MAG: tryptophan transporter [Clostridioides sp.]|jgi:hypothetical protein|nr:tryptophan transporter [Clostridioides sp.]